VGDLQDIEVRLRLRDFLIKLLLPCRKRLVFGPKSVLVDHAGLIEVVELVDFASQFLTVLFKDGK